MRKKCPDNWYKTGDLGLLNEEGYLKILGRKKEMIIKSGYNIFPREVKLVLNKHRQVKDAVIVGIPHATYDEIIRAYIILKDSGQSIKGDIKEFCKKHLIHYKVPDQLRIVETFPLTSTGKINKIALKENRVRA